MALTVTAVTATPSGQSLKLKTVGAGGGISIQTMTCTFTGNEATTDLGVTIVPGVTQALTGGVLGGTPRGDVIGYTSGGSVALVDAAAGTNGVVPCLDISGAAGPADFLYRNTVTGAMVSVDGAPAVTGWIATFVVSG